MDNTSEWSSIFFDVAQTWTRLKRSLKVNRPGTRSTRRIPDPRESMRQLGQLVPPCEEHAWASLRGMLTAWLLASLPPRVRHLATRLT